MTHGTELFATKNVMKLLILVLRKGLRNYEKSYLKANAMDVIGRIFVNRYEIMNVFSYLTDWLII